MKFAEKCSGEQQESYYRTSLNIKWCQVVLTEAENPVNKLEWYKDVTIEVDDWYGLTVKFPPPLFVSTFWWPAKSSYEYELLRFLKGRAI